MMLTRIAAIACVLVLSWPVHAQGLGLIKKGEPFPELVLPSMEDGTPMSIADFRGRRVMLHVFASW